MKPTWINYICAHMFKVVIFGGAGVFCFLILTQCGFSLETLKSPDALWLLPLILIIAFAVGCILNFTIYIFFAPVIFTICSKINGAPFTVGDTVQVLVGKHRGHCGSVFDVWPQRGQLRVLLDDDVRKDVIGYACHHVLKVEPKQQPEARAQG